MFSDNLKMFTKSSVRTLCPNVLKTFLDESFFEFSWKDTILELKKIYKCFAVTFH